VPEPESIPAFPAAGAPAADDLTAATAPKQATPARKRSGRTRKGSPPPVLVEVQRGDTVESRHRGHIVGLGSNGKLAAAMGAPTTEVFLRSTVKPFGVVTLIESGAADEFELTDDELAIMCASHTGEDKHVRTLQAIFRRASVTQALLECGTEGVPVDARTAARLARDGEKPGPLRHGCSGFHAASILLSAYADWPLEGYNAPLHPSQLAMRETVATIFGYAPDAIVVATDNCGVLTYRVTLAEMAQAYLLLADPTGPAADETRAAFAPALTRVRDAMMAAPEMVGGTYDNLDTELMRRRPGRLVAKAGADGLRAIGLVATDGAPAGAIVIKIEDGDLSRRAIRAASVEALAQAGVFDDRDLRLLAEDHHPTVYSPGGEVTATALPRFELRRLDDAR
jgi:L-asparaginase II